MTRRMLAWLGFTLFGVVLVQPAAAQKKAPEAAQAEISGGVVKFGVLTDETGVLSLASGVGSIEATRMAVEDFGSKAAGKPIEIIHADHQNKTDIGAAIARRWIEVDGVDAIVDVPNSAIALAVQEIAKEKNRVLLVSTAATVDLTGKACSPVGVHWIVTAESLIQEAEEARLAAMASGQNNAACSAVKVKAVLSGKWIERAEIGAPGEFETMTDDELERALMERMARLGLTDVGETQH
jgi:ABC-type branched-subunit amino acid transport system substrate-binding protein